MVFLLSSIGNQTEVRVYAPAVEFFCSKPNQYGLCVVVQ